MRTQTRAHGGRGRVADALAVLVAVLVVGGPALFTRDGFASDFTNHLWLVSVQQHAFDAHHWPMYFLDTPTQGAFNPFFMFSGGSVYALAGAAAAILGGHVVVAYVGWITLAIAAAYAGMLWLARQLGGRSWMAHAPAIAFITSAYYVTNLYGRAAWTEFIAVSSIPILMASALSLARSRRVATTPAVLFVLAAATFTGTHNITLLLGTMVITLLLIALRAGLGTSFEAADQCRIAWILTLGALAVAANAWFLLPDVLHGGDTKISKHYFSWADSGQLNTPWALFDPLRHVPRGLGTPALYVQAPVWFLGWAIVAGSALRRDARVSLIRAFAALSALLGFLLILVLIAPLYDAMPQIFKQIQVPYRLNTYVSLVIAGLVFVAVVGLEESARPRRARMLCTGLAFAVVISSVLCVWQLWVPDTHHTASYSDRRSALVNAEEVPRTWYATGAYADASANVVATGGRPPVLFATQLTHGRRVRATASPPPGLAPFSTNIVGGPYVVTVHGLIVLGRTQDGRMVLRRASDGNQPVAVLLERAGGAISVGRTISAVALILLLGLLVLAGLRRVLTPRRADSAERPEPTPS